MADRDAWEHPLYRFALVLLRDPELARRATLETLEAAVTRMPVHADADRFAMLLFQGVRRRALKGQTAPDRPATVREELPAAAAAGVTSATPATVEAALHALPEPGRSALALLLLDSLEAESIAKLLGLTEAEFANALHGARIALHRALTFQPEPTS